MDTKIFCSNNEEENHAKEFLGKHPDLSPIAVIAVRPIGTEPIKVAIPGDQFNHNGVRKQATTSVEEVKKSILAERTDEGKWFIAFTSQSVLFENRIVLLINDLYYQTYDIISCRIKNSAFRGIGSGSLSIGSTKIRDQVSLYEIAS